MTGRTLTLTWATLVVATLFGVGTASIFGHPLAAAAAIMLVAGGKVFLILRNFMELKDGPAGFQIFFTLWVIACVLAISGLFAFSG